MVTLSTDQTITAEKTFNANTTVKNLNVTSGFSHTGDSVAVFMSGTSSPSPAKTYFSDDGTNLQTLLDAKQNKIHVDNNLSFSNDTLSVINEPTFENITVYDDDGNFPGEATSPFGEDTDIDAYYYAKGISCYDPNSEAFVATLSFPAKSGTFALTSDIKTYTAGTNITISDDGVISATGGGSSYTAGSYISISSANVISNTFAGTETGTNSTATHGAKSAGSQSTAVGYGASSGGTSAVGIGNNANAGGAYAIAIGGNSAASYLGGCIAIGYNSKASKSSAMAIGYSAEASGQYSEAIGYDATASGTSSVAIGINTSAKGTNSVAIGGSSTINAGASATATGAISIGSTASATVNYQVSFPHVQFLTVADLSSATYTIPTNYVCLLFSGGMMMPTTVYAGSTIGKGSSYTGGYLAIIFKVS